MKKKNNVKSALNAFYAKKICIYPSYVSKHDEEIVIKKVVLLMIPNENRCERLETIAT